MDGLGFKTAKSFLERKVNMSDSQKEVSYSLGQLALKRLRKNKLSLLGIYIILFAVLISLFGSIIRPDKTTDANDQMLQLARNKPGFSVELLLVTKNKEVVQTPWWRRMLFGGAELSHKAYPIHKYYFRGDELVAEEFHGRNDVMKGKELVFKLADILYPVQYDQTIISINDSQTFQLISGDRQTAQIAAMRKEILKGNIQKRTFWLGTDKFGRDLLSRIMGGTVVSLGVGVISVLISLIIGISLGAIAGYYRGWIDDAIMWLINVIWSVPTLLLVMAITLALGKGFTQVFIAVGFTMWVEVARVVRGQVLSLREQEFVEAGKALGYGSGRIISKHIVPNVMGPVIVVSAANFASAILIEAGLSFLGIGAQIPTPSWGQMIKEHYSYITTDLAYMAVLPGVCIMILVLAFMLLGNGLRDALDHKSAGLS
jgi:peptide/nickel transport system permease protein